MARSDEAQAFFHAVYSAVQEIPHGKVTTYGHIAALVGTRTYSLFFLCQNGWPCQPCLAVQGSRIQPRTRVSTSVTSCDPIY